VQRAHPYCMSFERSPGFLNTRMIINMAGGQYCRIPTKGGRSSCNWYKVPVEWPRSWRGWGES